MKRKHKQYSKPKRPFDKVRLEEEAKLKEEFGLKNKKEIWRAEAKIKSIREKAKKLISAEASEQKALFDRLKKIGFEVNSIADVLSLEEKDYLNRRLQTVLIKKKLARTPGSSRQLITHKKVLINNRVVDSPSYIVPIELENKISLKKKEKKKAEAVAPSPDTISTQEIVNKEDSDAQQDNELKNKEDPEPQGEVNKE